MLFFLLLIPIIWPFVAKVIWNATVTWKEMLANIVIVSFIVSITYAGGMYMDVTDTEILNGEITSKYQERTSCSHSYNCFCYSDKDGEHCSICYYHSHDYNWVVKSSVDSFNIDRIDSQGVVEPPRWSIIKIGDPMSRDHRFINYIKAAPDSLFHNSDVLIKQFEKYLPKYPEVYDYYKVNHVINVGTKITDLKNWNDDISMILRKLGPVRQANIIVVFTNITDRNYATAIEEYWQGGKKNDIIIVISTDNTNILWTKIISWTDKQIFKVTLRDDIDTIKVLDRKKIVETIERDTMQFFVRKSMEDFEYLKDDIDPPLWLLIFCMILGIIGTIGVSYFFHKNEVF